MLNELAHFSLNIALGFAVLGTIIPLLGATLRRSSWMQLASVFALLQFLLVAFTFGVLTLAFVTSDFSLRLVVLNSHTLKPMIYKIAGVWGNHEGSLLLWVLILTFFAACAAL
ncbi:heme lyase NrfEFG subunit NrfE, partial [Planktomarina temperata]|nr:heme lyase NrfEFG subunit NrfE [Planktomarina temperata]